jgi:hypothetical protein
MVDLPEMIGHAAQAFTPDDSAVNRLGASMVKFGKEREELPQYQTTGAFGAGARFVVPALGGLAATAAAAPVVGTTAAGALSTAALGALFGGSTYQDIKERGLAAGTDPDVVHAQAVKGGLVQGIGQGLAQMVGGRVLAGAGGALVNKVIAKGGVDNAIQSFTNPGFLKPFGKTMLEMAGVQLPLQAGTSAAMNEIEEGAGINTGQTSWEAAKASLAPTAAMTMLLSPVGAWGVRASNKVKARTAELVSGTDPTATQEQRKVALAAMAKEMRKTAPLQDVTEWQQQAELAILNDKPVGMKADFKYTPDAEPTPPLALPGPRTALPSAVPLEQAGGTAEQAADENAARIQAARDAEEERLAALRGGPPTEPPAEPPGPGGAGPGGVPPMEESAAAATARTPKDKIAAQVGAQVGLQGEPTAREIPPRQTLLERVPRAPESTRLLDLPQEATKQEQVDDLKKNFLPTAPKDLIARLIGPLEEMPAKIKQLWTEKGGETSDATYVKHLGDLYKRITGEEINAEGMKDEGAARNEPSEVAPEERARTEPEPAPVQAEPEAAPRPVEVAQAQGDAGTGGEARAAAQEPALTKEAKAKAAKAANDAEVTGSVTDLRQYRAQDKATRQEAESLVAEAREALTTGQLSLEEVEAARGATPLDTMRNLNTVLAKIRNKGRAGAANDEPAPVPKQTKEEKAKAAKAAKVSEETRHEPPTAEEGARALAEGQPADEGIFPRAGGTDAVIPGQEERGGEPQGGTGGGEAAGAGAGDRTVGVAEGGTEAQGGEQNAQVREQRRADNRRFRAHGDLAAYDAKTQALIAEANALEKRDPESPDLRRKRLEIGRRMNEGRKELHRRAIDANAEADRVRDKWKEPGWDAGNALYAMPNALNENNHADTLSFLAARELLGEKLSDEEKALLSNRGIEKKGTRAKEEADLAMKSLSADQKARWQARVERMAASAKLMDEMATIRDEIEKKDKKREGRTARNVQQEADDRLDDEQKLQAIDESVKGWVKVTSELGTHWVVEGHEKQVLDAMAAAANRDAIQSRGLSGISDAALGAKVALTPHAGTIMEHLAKTHNNPLMRVVAKMLAKANPNAEIVEIPGAAFNGGRYVPSSHRIEIGRGGMNPITLMHETVHSLAHAAIYRAMDNLTRPFAELHPQERKEMEGLQVIRNAMDAFAKVADYSREDHRLALDNEHEFLAEALNNPHIQEALGGRSGWYGRVVNWVRSLFGKDAINQTDFEKLMDVTPSLFGSPNRSLTEVFNSNLNRAEKIPGSPPQLIGETKAAFSKAAELMSQARKLVPSDLDLKALALWLKGTTVNNKQHMLRNYRERVVREFPKVAPLFDRVIAAHDAIQRVTQSRNAGTQHLMNAPGEGNDQVREAAKFAHENKQQAREMFELQRRERDAGVFSGDTWKQAEARGVTRDMFNSPLAVENRTKMAAMRARDLARFEKEFAAAKNLNPALTKDTWNGPLTATRVYDHMATYHELTLQRTAMEQLAAMRKTWGLNTDPSLYWKAHTYGKDNRAITDPRVQLQNVKAAIARSRAATAAAIEKAGFDPKSKFGQDVTSYREASESMLNEANRQANVPYSPRTRPGEFFLHAEIADKPGLYERVRSIVRPEFDPKNPNAGGLGRDMGPELKGGSRTIRMHFDNEGQLKYAEQRLQALRDEGAFHTKAKEGLPSEDTFASGTVIGDAKPHEGATAGWVRAFEKRIDDNPDWKGDVKQQMKQEVRQAYINSLTEMNPLKALKHADKSAGASTDMVRGYSDRLQRGTTQLSAIRAASLMGDAMNQLNNAMGEIEKQPANFTEHKNKLAVFATEAKRRVDDTRTAVNTPFRDAIRAIAAPFRLALSPAYLMMTAYQPWQMTLPWLGGKHGYVTSAATMARNYGVSHAMMSAMITDAYQNSSGTSKFQKLVDAANPAAYFSNIKRADGTYLFDGAKLEAVNRLAESGLTAFGQYNQIWRPQTTEGFEAAKGGLQQANRLASLLPHYVEMSNRIVAYLSAHELYLTKGIKYAEGATKAERAKARDDMMNAASAEQKRAAEEYALGMIRDTDGDHSQGNIARMFGRHGFIGGSTPLVVGFGQYDLQMVESMIRSMVTAAGRGDIKNTGAKVAAKQLAGVVAMTSLMAGTLGAPFMGLMTGLWNRLGSMFQDDADTPPDFEKSWRDAMEGIFGEKGGEIVSRGLPHLLDFDMSQRSGYQDLAPFTNFLTDRQKIDDTIKTQAMNFLGPAVGVGVGVATGSAAAIRGNWPQAIDDALPAFARNLFKAGRLAAYGYERKSDGNAPIPLHVSTWNVVMQAGGFGSAAKEEEGEMQNYWNVNQAIMQQRIAKIRNKWLVAQDHGDAAGVGDAMEDLVHIAEVQPQYAGAPSSVGPAYKARQQAVALGQMTGGVGVHKRALPFFMQFQGANHYPELAAPNY